MTRFPRVCLLTLALLCTTHLTLGTAAGVPDPVKDCPRGLICFTIEQAGAIDLKLIELTRDVKLAKAKERRFGIGATCGPGASMEVESSTISIDQHLLSCSAGITVRIF